MKTFVNCSEGCAEAAEIIRKTETPDAVVYFVLPNDKEWGVTISDEGAPERSVYLGTAAAFKRLDTEDAEEYQAAKDDFFKYLVELGFNTPDSDFAVNFRAALSSDAIIDQFRFKGAKA